jgi:hypothetical protein
VGRGAGREPGKHVRDAAACEEALRQFLAARLSLDLLADMFHVPVAIIAAMRDGDYPPLDENRRERLALFTAILTRAEIRCGHDSHTMARLLRTPLADLGDRAPLDAMRGGLDERRQAHRLIGTMELPAEH